MTCSSFPFIAAMSKYFLSSHRLGIGLRLRILDILSHAIEFHMIERYGDLFDGARLSKSKISEKVTGNLVNSLDIVMKHSEKRVDKVFEAQKKVRQVSSWRSLRSFQRLAILGMTYIALNCSKKILERSLPMRGDQTERSSKAFMKEVLQTSAKLRLAKRYRRVSQ